MSSPTATWVFFICKRTEDVIDNIYDRIKDVKMLYQHKPNAPSIRWRRRVININKRILVLLQHLGELEPDEASTE